MISLFHTSMTEEEQEKVIEVMDSGNFSMGEQVAALENELTDYMVESPGRMVATSSGTDGLILAMKFTGCNGRGVIVPAMTFSATYEAVVAVGGIPVVCDIDEETLTPRLDQVRSAMSQAIYGGIPIGAVVIVHLYGWPAYDTQEIVAFCRNQNIICIEDCAQAFGAKMDGQFVGTFGDAAAFSFYPTKPLGGITEGGAATFRDPSGASQAAMYRNHGRLAGIQMLCGRNMRMNEITASVLRHRLAKYPDNVHKRREMSGRYHSNGMKKLSIARQGFGVPCVYPVLVEDREAVRFRLAEIGVQTKPHYDPPVSELPYVSADCTITRFAAKRQLSLPCHQAMTFEDVDRIADAVRG
jgi:dTDP-4-amino-4,6-dideoxygalactose transaminase